MSLIIEGKTTQEREPIARFEKVSYEEFSRHFHPEKMPPTKLKELRQMYEDIKLPTRATVNSAGYDFFAPFTIGPIAPSAGIRVPTGIRVEFLDTSYVLIMAPKSGLGCRYRMQLDNTIGVIDSDYYYSDNEGHIHLSITNDGRPPITKNAITGKPEIPSDAIINIPTGKAFMQGIFLQYGIAEEAPVTTVRNGGFGSTN